MVSTLRVLPVSPGVAYNPGRLRFGILQMLEFDDKERISVSYHSAVDAPQNQFYRFGAPAVRGLAREFRLRQVPYPPLTDLGDAGPT